MEYKCGGCKKRFSVRAGTIMEHSRVSFQKCLLPIDLMVTVHKGFSCVQFAKHLGIAQKVAWGIEHRIRWACENNANGEVLTREVDSNYIGGKCKNIGNAKLKALEDTGCGTVGQATVTGMQERGGKVVVQQEDMETLYPLIEENVEEGSSVYTGEHKVFNPLRKAFDLKSASEYVKGNASTNCIESFWALIKRGYDGTHHWWSFKHLHRYVSEYVYHQNTRELTRLATMGALIKNIEGETLPTNNLSSNLHYEFRLYLRARNGRLSIPAYHHWRKQRNWFQKFHTLN